LNKYQTSIIQLHQEVILKNDLSFFIANINFKHLLINFLFLSKYSKKLILNLSLTQILRK